MGRTDPLTSSWKHDQVLECLIDPKTWFFFAISVLTQIPNGGTQSFGNLVIVSFGFTNLDSTLITLPASVIAIVTIIATGALASRYCNITTFLLILVVIPPVVGSAIIYSTTAKGIRLFAYYCLQTGPAGIPLALGLISANYKGVTKKMTITAVLFVAYCAGNIAGPQTFISAEADTGYPTAFKAIMSCYALVIVMALGLRAYLTFENKRRDRMEKAVVDAQTIVDGKRNLTSADYEDLTDWKTLGFRYRM